MKRKRRLFGILLIITALIIMQLPVSEADAATSASDFRMEGTTLVKYRGTEESVSVPDTVEVIAEGAFEGNSYVELVVLPKSVKKIEPYAFWDCENLETVVLNTGMTEIGDFAFANCKGLKKMFIPENIRSIGVQAFMDCVNMTDITIAPEVTNIHETAFDGCYRLTIHCEKGSYADKYAEGFYERQKEMPEYEDVDSYLPDGEEDTENTLIPDVEEENPGELLGDTKVVGNQAVVFIDNTSLEVMSGKDADSELLVEGSLVTGNGSDLNELPKYTIVNGKIVADQAYYRNQTLQEVTLPSGIEEIGQFSFARSSIQKVQLSEGVKIIGYGAFYHCDNLVEVVLPETIEVVEPNAFSYTAWVKNFQASGTSDYLISGGVLVAYRGQQEKVNVPEGVRVIAAEAFANHAEIKELVLPQSLISVGEAAFENCSNLSTVVLGEQLKQIKDRAFLGCNIHNVTLPKTMEAWGINAFDKKVQITYGGEIPSVTHELTAERLSNEAYRNVWGEEQNTGVNATGVAGIIARLEGAARTYQLTVTEAADNSKMHVAYERCFGEEFPEQYLLYDLQLTDSSQIPITKLGKQPLQVNVLLSDTYASQKLVVYSLDRNGQLEKITAKRVRIDGAEYLRFELNYLSQVAIVGTGTPGSGVIVLEETTSIKNMSRAPEQVMPVVSTVRWQWILSAMLMSVGMLCLLWKKNRI